jgi:hypothetical protein
VGQNVVCVLLDPFYVYEPAIDQYKLTKLMLHNHGGHRFHLRCQERIKGQGELKRDPVCVVTLGKSRGGNVSTMRPSIDNDPVP